MNQALEYCSIFINMCLEEFPEEIDDDDQIIEEAKGQKSEMTNDELKQIFKNMVVKSGFTLEEDALEEVDRLINENRNAKNFGNARFIRT